MPSIVLCRFGELFLKRGNRSMFENTLRDNVARALRGVPDAKVLSPHGRVIVRLPSQHLETATARVERVFGLVSVSPAEEIAPDIDTIEATAIAMAQATLERWPELRRSFRVDARRSDKRFALSSHDIAVRVGARVAVATGLPVDLSNATLTVGVEVGAESAYVYAQHRAAPGGLPVGVSGRALLLLSGGIDSPVAGWLAAKRGLALDALYFHSPPFVGEKSRDKVITLARELHRWGAMGSLFVAPFTDAQKALRESGPAELAVVLYRRMMMRVADRIADRTRASALVTGENLGQVASQTVTNMRTIEVVARHLVLRPLLTHDKSETIALARRIGTYDTSVLPYDDCCSLFVPPHPATGARICDAERGERGLDVEAIANTVAEATERIDLGEVKAPL